MNKGIATLVMMALPGLVWAAPDDLKSPADQHFRLGLQFYGMVPTKTPTQGEMLGAGVELPFTVNVYKGLGFRVSFLGYYHRDTDLGASWKEPDPSFDDGDGVWEVGERPQPLAGGGRVHDQALTHNAMFSFVLAVNYELVIPGSSVTEHVQPYIGVGGVGSWLQNYYDVQGVYVYLIDNDEHNLSNSDEIDMYSTQNQPAFTLYGGVHFNLGPSFRINIEVGGLTMKVAEAAFDKATAGFDAKHDAYNVSLFKFGGGFVGRF